MIAITGLAPSVPTASILAVKHMGTTAGASRVVALCAALSTFAACGEDKKPRDSATAGAGTGGTTGNALGGAGGVSPGTSGAGAGAGSGANGGGANPALGAPFIPTRIASNEDENCVITREQQLYCWGKQTSPPPYTPGVRGITTQVSMQWTYRCTIAGEKIDCASGVAHDARPLQGVYAEVRMGLHAACARDKQGMITCWTDGNAEAAPILENLPTEPAKSFYIALDTACALLVSGTTYCWGFDAMDYMRLDPPRSDFLAVGGWTEMYGIAPDGSVVGWGLGPSVRLELSPGQDYVQIAAGTEHLAMLRADGTVDSVGDDAAVEPTDVRFVELSAGDGQTCGITGTGTVHCWGNETGGRFASPPETVRAF